MRHRYIHRLFSGWTAKDIAEIIGIGVLSVLMYLWLSMVMCFGL